MKFYKIPFIWLFIPFIIGIILTDFISINFLEAIILLFSAFTFLILLFSSKRFNRNSFLNLTILFITLYFLGNSVMLLQKNNNSENQISIANKNNLYIGEILESSITNSGYRKCIIKCKTSKNLSKSAKSTMRLIFIKPGQTNHFVENSRIVFLTEFQKIKNIGYPGEFDSEYYWRNKGISKIAFIDSNNVQLISKKARFYLHPMEIRNKLSNILKKTLSGQELALANALILGERSLLTNKTTRNFSNTGAMHILAVSGLHIGILLQLLLLILSLFKKQITKTNATLLSISLLWLYAIITGFSPSVVRSVVMFTFIFLGTLRGKANSELNILALSAILILCWNPFYLYDIGFQLSYSAMLGIYLFYPFLKKQFVSRFKLVQLISEGTMVGIAAQITTLPLTLYYFHQFPNYFILTNIALMAFSFFILLIGLLLFLFFWIPLVKILFGFILQKTMSLMLGIVSFISDLPFSIATGFSLTKTLIILIYICIFSLLFSLFHKKQKLIHISLTGGLLIALFIFQKRIENHTMNIDYNHKSYPNFKIIKNGKLNYFIFPSKNFTSNKTKRVIQDFKTIYPGKSILVPMENIKGL